MAQKYVVVERKNPLKPQEPAKFYAMARSNRRVDTVMPAKRQRNSRRPPVSRFPVSVFIREACFWTCVRQ